MERETERARETRRQRDRETERQRDRLRGSLKREQGKARSAETARPVFHVPLLPPFCRRFASGTPASRRSSCSAARTPARPRRARLAAGEGAPRKLCFVLCVVWTTLRNRPYSQRVAIGMAAEWLPRPICAGAGIAADGDSHARARAARRGLAPRSLRRGRGIDGAGAIWQFRIRGQEGPFGTSGVAAEVKPRHVRASPALRDREPAAASLRLAVAPPS